MAAQVVYLPSNVKVSAVGKITDRSVVQESETGIQARFPRESFPKRSFQIGWNKAEVPQVEDMFTVFGRHTPFLVFLPRVVDHTATAQNIGNANGTRTQFQLRVSVTQGTKTVSRDILHPKTTTVSVTVNAVAVTEGVDYAVDYTTGIVTFGSAPASGAVVATFDYYTAFYFDSDELSTTITRTGSAPVQEIGSLTILEAPNE